MSHVVLYVIHVIVKFLISWQGSKIRFRSFFMVDTLGHKKCYRIVFFGKIFFHLKEKCKLLNFLQIVIWRTILVREPRMQNHIIRPSLKTLK